MKSAMLPITTRPDTVSLRLPYDVHFSLFRQNSGTITRQLGTVLKVMCMHFRPGLTLSSNHVGNGAEILARKLVFPEVFWLQSFTLCFGP